LTQLLWLQLSWEPELRQPTLVPLHPLVLRTTLTPMPLKEPTSDSSSVVSSAVVVLLAVAVVLLALLASSVAAAPRLRAHQRAVSLLRPVRVHPAVFLPLLMTVAST
jgi:hypothetical protein